MNEFKQSDESSMAAKGLKIKAQLKLELIKANHLKLKDREAAFKVGD